MKTLTKRQRQVYDFIVRFIDRYGHAPSYGEIAQGVGLSSQSTVYVHVENLQKKGYLTKKWNASRSIDLPETRTSAPEAAELPLVGNIAAGLPIEAIEQQETLAVPADMVGRRDTFVLHVKGDSMIEDHVVDGDFIIVEKRSHASDGDMVVALVHGQDATLKRYRRVGDKIRLEPANPIYQAMTYDEDEVKVQGVVIGILRKY